MASMHTVVIGVGSNINPQDNILMAKDTLTHDHQFLAESAFQTTEPIGLKDQPSFLNGAFLIKTKFSFTEFSTYLKGIERSLGRSHAISEKFGPRSIDLDIIVWEGEVVHPDFYKRDFVQKAVLELLPDLSAR